MGTSNLIQNVCMEHGTFYYLLLLVCLMAVIILSPGVFNNKKSVEPILGMFVLI